MRTTLTLIRPGFLGYFVVEFGESLRKKITLLLFTITIITIYNLIFTKRRSDGYKIICWKLLTKLGNDNEEAIY